MKLPLFVFVFSFIARASTPPAPLATFPNSTVYAVTTDAAGNIYVAGNQGNPDAANPFVAKLNPGGAVLYSTTFSGSKFGIASAVAVDAGGSAYVFGTTNSPDFPVTPGALQTTFQALRQQGFAAKLDPNGKIVYSTFIGGSSDVAPGLTSAPTLNSILVDSAGDAILTGEAQANSPGSTPFPPTSGMPASDSGGFVIKLDPLGGKILAAVSGIGGEITMDSQGNVYVVGLQFGGTANPLPVTPGAFQNEPANVCGGLGNFFECQYQYVAKLNAGLTTIDWATYVSGKYGASPVAISVDSSGNVFIVGTTNSPDYPTTPNAFEPQYIASAVPKVSCFFIINCVNLPPASGYVTELNPNGTGLVYSSYFSGTQTDTITFAAFTANAIYIAGSAGSADLPGLDGFPQQCLPQTYATRLSADATEIGASRVTPGSVLAYDAFAGTLITSVGQSTPGDSLVAVGAAAPQTPIACILDSADLHPVTSIAPGELLSLFGEFSSGGATIPPPGQFPTSLGGVTVDVNGNPSPLLYTGPQQINFQAPFALAGASSANIAFASPQLNLSDSLTLPVVAVNPVAFLNTTAPSPALAACIMVSPASLGGLWPLTLNPDGSLNTCTNPAAAGSVVSLFLDGLGVTSPAQTTGAVTPDSGPPLNSPVITSNAGLTVVSVSALPNAISGAWQVDLQIPVNEAAGGLQFTLSAGGVPVRDANLIVWVQ